MLRYQRRLTEISLTVISHEAVREKFHLTVKFQTAVQGTQANDITTVHFEGARDIGNTSWRFQFVGVRHGDRHGVTVLLLGLFYFNITFARQYSGTVCVHTAYYCVCSACAVWQPCKYCMLCV